MVAGAGFGKSTLVAGALRANLVSRRGDDCWLGCEPDDATARHLAADLWTALHRNADTDHGSDRQVPPLPPDDDLATSIAEAIWARAPRHVAVVLDDVHELPPGSGGAALVDELIRALPSNGHLVLTSRSEPPVSLARARAHGDVIDLTEDDLAFTDDELTDFARLRDTDVEHLERVGGWPALAELTAGARNHDVDGFLFEEVLARRTADDVATIEALALLGGGDHELLGEVLGRPVTASDLARTLVDVPMASRDAEGGWTLHRLWTHAIQDRLPPERRADTIRRAGRALQRRDPARAIELLTAVDAGDHLRPAIRALLETPWASVSSERLLGLHRRLPPDGADWPEAQLLLAAATSAASPVAAQTTLRSVAEHAEAIGDHALGLLALERLVVITHRRQDVDGVIDAFARAHRLAQHDQARAAALVGVGDALLAEAAGDATRVLEVLDRLRPDQLDAYWRAPLAWVRAQALLALGHPEAALEHSALAVATAPIALRGEVAMLHVNVLAHSGRVDAALEQIPATIALLDQYGTTEARAMAHGQAVQRYAMNGDLDRARRHLDLARDLAGPDPAAPLRANLAAAESMLALTQLDEDRAREIITAAIADHPLGVGRQQYHERRRLALSYVLLPDTRPFWDDEPLGPAFALTRTSAQAIVAHREQGDIRPAGRLDAGHWADAPASLPLPWMLELAVAAAATGSEEAELVLKSLPPDAATYLAHIADRTPVRPVARRALATIATMPALPSHRIRLDVLGPLDLHLDGNAVDDPNWRRERVRTLLAYLVTRRRATREEVAAALWPDLDGKAADRNLRVTLSYLHSVLEPGRASGAPAYFVRSDGGQLVLADGEALSLDVDEFSDAVDRAADERRHGSPAVELEQLLGAVALYRGTFMADLGPEEWVLDERNRLRARFVGAAVRAGELALAHGDAERARRLADQAIAEEPWSEPARRLLVAAHLDLGDRAAARRALDACLAMLDELGVEPETDTEIVVRRLGQSDHAP